MMYLVCLRSVASDCTVLQRNFKRSQSIDLSDYLRYCLVDVTVLFHFNNNNCTARNVTTKSLSQASNKFCYREMNRENAPLKFHEDVVFVFAHSFFFVCFFVCFSLHRLMLGVSCELLQRE